MGAIELGLLAVGFVLAPWGIDRKTQTTDLLYGKNAKLHRLNDSQARFVKLYPMLRTVLSILLFLSTASLLTGAGDSSRPIFIASLVALFASIIALLWATGRAGALAMKTLKV